MSAPREQRLRDESTRTSMRLSRSNDDEEDYALSAMGISDGFRPSNAAASHNRMSSQGSRRDSARQLTPPPRPSSIAKPRGPDSFLLRHDGLTGSPRLPAISNPTNDQTPITRASTVSTASTDLQLITAESPYQGPLGPSHPYHMYPQVTRPMRTASVATASTFQPSESNYTGPSGPAHPYGMYPQDTTADSERPVPVPAIPVGFPGRRDEYQRRIGPDGEEAADIIGPMGHTEQLPPYTQYPTESFGKLRGPPLVPGAGGIGLATRNPEFESREDLGFTDSRQSTRSLTSDTPQVNMAALGDSEKYTDKRWKQIAQKKACGVVPVWALVLVGGVCLFFAIVLGAVLGILGSRHHSSLHHTSGYQSSGEDQGDTPTTTVTTTMGASALTSVPTGIPVLPTGTFLLPIKTPFSSQQTCLDSSDLYPAWSCALPMSMVQVTVSRLDNNTNSLNNNNVSITHNANFLSTWFYGSQPPSIVAQQTLDLVRDLQQPSLGPAWFFQIPYNKVVVVPESIFAAPTKRNADHEFDNNFRRKDVAQPGEKPWFCHWNATLLEVFIYVNNTSDGDFPGSLPSSSTTSSISAPTGAVKHRNAMRSEGGSAPRAYASSYPSATNEAIPSTTGYYSNPNIPPRYPKIIKVEERRIPHSPQPYCDQMLIQSDGSAIPNKNSDGSQVRIKLNETVPSYMIPGSGSSRRSTVGDLEIEARQSDQQCTCVWLTS